MSKLKLQTHLLPLESGFPILPGCRATMFSSRNCNLPFFIHVPLACFPNWHQLTCSQQGKLCGQIHVSSSQGLMLPFPPSIWEEPKRLKASTSSAEKRSHGDWQWSHWAELENWGNKCSGPYCLLSKWDPQCSKSRMLFPVVNFNRRTKAEFYLYSVIFTCVENIEALIFARIWVLTTPFNPAPPPTACGTPKILN